MPLPGNLKKKEREKEQKLVLCKLKNKISIPLISEIFVSVAGILSQSGVMKLFLSS